MNNNSLGGEAAETTGFQQALQLILKLVPRIYVLGVLQDGLDQLFVEQLQEALEQLPRVPWFLRVHKHIGCHTKAGRTRWPLLNPETHPTPSSLNKPMLTLES